MHVISPKMLRKFWTLHAAAERPLRRWLRIAERAEWSSFVDIRAVYAHADQVGKFVVLNIGGNKYQLVATIHYNRAKVFPRSVLTHTDYDHGKWKED